MKVEYYYLEHCSRNMLAIVELNSKTVQLIFPVIQKASTKIGSGKKKRGKIELRYKFIDSADYELINRKQLKEDTKGVRRFEVPAVQLRIPFPVQKLF